MNRSLVRAAACTLAAAALILVLLAVPASSPSQAASFTFSGSNCTSFSWDASSNTLTCNSSSPGTFGCSISASPSASTTVTTAVTLTANCSDQAGSIAYTWTAAANAAGCPSIASGASQETLTAPGGTTTLSCGYNLSANDGATTATANKTVSYSSGGGGGGGGGSIQCAGFATTQVIDIKWGSAATATTSSFGANDAIVVRFTTSTPITTSIAKGYVKAAQFVDGDTGRTGTLSETYCDFSGGLPIPGSTLTSAFFNDVAPTIYFSLSTVKTGYPTLQPGKMYYFNIKNASCSSLSGTCNMSITLSKPSGT